VIQPGAANRTWWQDTQIGRIFGQLKGFSIASPLKLGMTPFQMVGQRQYLQAARFVGFLMPGAAIGLGKQRADLSAADTGIRGFGVIGGISCVDGSHTRRLQLA
jgi:hypothetical protein